jgi:hypothetical protein
MCGGVSVSRASETSVSQASGKPGSSHSGRRPRDAQQRAVSERAKLEQELIGTLRTELLEAVERTAQLEKRVQRLEGQLYAANLPDEATPPPPNEPEVVAHLAVRPIESSRWDEAAERAYWLRRCEGFRVCDSSGVLGTVDSIRFGHDLDLPDTLVVLAQRRGRRRRFEIAVSELAKISPEQEEITLAVPARDWLLPTASRSRRLSHRGGS